ncbi:MAG: hypothetical protein ACRDS0_23475 [Pseudonocardiaceae bacterium]
MTDDELFVEMRYSLYPHQILELDLQLRDAENIATRDKWAEDAAEHADDWIVDGDGGRTAKNDDVWFDSVGDMLTPAELRELDLHVPEHIATRDKWLAEYKATGIADDQDPGEFTFELSIEDDMTAEQLAERGVAITEYLAAIRHMQPGDVVT